MILSQLLNPEAVSVDLKARTKKDVIVELVGILEKAHSVQSGGDILERVLKREAMMTTGRMSPAWSLVFALNSLQKPMMLTPCAPKAGPTGGAGFAAPAGN